MIFLRRLCLFLIKIYQMAISPHFPPCCRYVPSCSVYAYQAVEKYGVFRGGFLALKRLLRCHPFHEGGYDPLPDLPKNRAATVSSAREKTFTLKNFIVCEGFNTPRQIPYQNNISRCLRRGC